MRARRAAAGREVPCVSPRIVPPRIALIAGIALILVACYSFHAPDAPDASEPPRQVVVIGDSTASAYDSDHYPLSGWGQVLSCALDSTAVVLDQAASGRSTRSFQSDRLWDAARDRLQPGDVLLIQFGHNDESTDADRHVAPRPEFMNNLELFVAGARERGATPVLLTPVARHRFENGGVLETHREYSDVVREVAAAMMVPLVDLDADSRALLSRLGDEASKALYLYLPAGYSPAWPDGLKDDTHFSETGARQVAQLIAAALATLDTPLRGHVNPDVPALQPSFLAGGPSCSAPVSP